ncbi:hypothetical protein PLEOSDRAFT_1099563 [Pleurotus ostreatus PC15]|uniref:Uncharacterized protein n=1 Tax=Pleurotus ostreatus (strain PC15) TaxID=1137138 RepID=A0A067P0A7_PLEO1|nr:hypothetical protein PLEOSDRAFT_1099563 [Pleurotus ostreatus PC15]
MPLAGATPLAGPTLYHIGLSVDASADSAPLNDGAFKICRDNTFCSWSPRRTVQPQFYGSSSSNFPSTLSRRTAARDKIPGGDGKIASIP